MTPKSISLLHDILDGVCRPSDVGAWYAANPVCGEPSSACVACSLLATSRAAVKAAVSGVDPPLSQRSAQFYGEASEHSLPSCVRTL